MLLQAFVKARNQTSNNIASLPHHSSESVWEPFPYTIKAVNGARLSGAAGKIKQVMCIWRVTTTHIVCTHTCMPAPKHASTHESLMGSHPPLLCYPTRYRCYLTWTTASRTLDFCPSPMTRGWRYIDQSWQLWVGCFVGRG